MLEKRDLHIPSGIVVNEIGSSFRSFGGGGSPSKGGGDSGEEMAMGTALEKN